jgi:hypothetical protein
MRWTIVMKAAQSHAPWGRAQLCRLFWYPLYIFDEEVHAFCEALMASERRSGPESAPEAGISSPGAFVGLKAVPQPVVVLLQKLLQKDAAQRFRTPSELLTAIPTITSALDTGQRIIRQSLLKTPPSVSCVGTRKPPTRPEPKKISLARLPVTGSDLFGREEDIAFLDHAWANEDVNVVTIVAWAGVGKSTLVNHWLRRMATDRYRSAQLIFAWSFYRQGTSGGTSSAHEFLDAALAWFGDPDPQKTKADHPETEG